MGEVSSKRCVVPSLQMPRTLHVSVSLAPVYSEDSPDSAMDSAFLGATGTNQELIWKMKLQLSEQETEFKFDTGAEVTAISDQIFQGIASCQLTAPSKKLYGPARNALASLRGLSLIRKGQVSRLSMWSKD